MTPNIKTSFKLKIFFNTSTYFLWDNNDYQSRSTNLSFPLSYRIFLPIANPLLVGEIPTKKPSRFLHPNG